MREQATSAKVRWGVLGAAGIAVTKVIPAMQRGEWSEVVAIASRDQARARAAADSLGIARAHGSYEALLADPEVDAVYIPLPNHLHVPWSIRAAEAGKHVLCEKPLGLGVAEVRDLVAVRDRTGLCIGEAFMARVHPQWVEARRLVRAGRLGEVQLVTGHFSYFNRDPANVRNRVDWGGGALLDIGCYPVTLSRFVYDEEPARVLALVERDPEMQVDRLTAGLLEFPSGQASFTCATQLVPFHRMEIFGTRARLEVEIPFNAPPDRPTRLLLDERGPLGAPPEVVELPAVDQYTVQGDLFSLAVLGRGEVPVPLEDALHNTAALVALFRSAGTGHWEVPQAAD